MAEFKFNVSANAAKQMERGVDTGVHKVKILKGFVSSTKNANNVLDLELETMSGAKTAVYGICIDEKWASGAENFDFPMWNELAICANMKTGEMYETVRKDKDGKEVAAKAFKELEGKIVNIGLFSEIGVFNSQETKKRKISRVFFENGLSIAERDAGKTEGKTIKKLEDKITDYYTKEHKEWKENGSTGSSVSSDAATSAQSTAEEDLI